LYLSWKPRNTHISHLSIHTHTRLHPQLYVVHTTMAPVDVGVRIHALTWLELGYTPAQIEASLGVLRSAIYQFPRIAIDRGYSSQESRECSN
jgi:hypothetical protein